MSGIFRKKHIRHCFPRCHLTESHHKSSQRPCHQDAAEIEKHSDCDQKGAAPKEKPKANAFKRSASKRNSKSLAAQIDIRNECGKAQQTSESANRIRQAPVE